MSEDLHKNHDRYFVPGLARGLRVLEIIAEADQPLTIAEIGKKLGVSRSSAFRITYTLNHLGYLSTDKTDKADLRDKCYSHDTTSTYANPSYRRGLFRTLALRTTRLTHEQSTYLGMQDGELEDISKPGKWPLLKLCVELDKLTRRPRLDELDNKVVP